MLELGLQIWIIGLNVLDPGTTFVFSGISDTSLFHATQVNLSEFHWMRRWIQTYSSCSHDWQMKWEYSNMDTFRKRISECLAACPLNIPQLKSIKILLLISSITCLWFKINNKQAWLPLKYSQKCCKLKRQINIYFS